jgi:hypothetical protein
MPYPAPVHYSASKSERPVADWPRADNVSFPSEADPPYLADRFNVCPNISSSCLEAGLLPLARLRCNDLKTNRNSPVQDQEWRDLPVRSAAQRWTTHLASAGVTSTPLRDRDDEHVRLLRFHRLIRKNESQFACARSRMEGPACQVRCATLDNPSRFSGRDKHAPPRPGRRARPSIAIPSTHPQIGRPTSSAMPLFSTPAELTPYLA